MEQLVDAGDTRLGNADHLCDDGGRQATPAALKLFDWSRLLSGLTQSRYPARVRQVIPPFSLWWISSCHDYALLAGGIGVHRRALLPGIRAVCDHFGSSSAKMVC